MTTRLGLIAGLFGLAMVALHVPALAGAADYRFEAITTEVRNGEGATLAVRLVHVPTGKPVPGAIVFRSRLDMAPDGMAAMTARHQ
jgi:Flp pilus assembly pilin Flp